MAFFKGKIVPDEGTAQNGRIEDGWLSGVYAFEQFCSDLSSWLPFIDQILSAPGWHEWVLFPTRLQLCRPAHGGRYMIFMYSGTLIKLLMKRLLQITIIASILTGSAFSARAQERVQNTSSARAAYGNAVNEFKFHKKRNQKAKKKAIKSAKRKNAGKTTASYFRGKPY